MACGIIDGRMQQSTVHSTRPTTPTGTLPDGRAPTALWTLDITGMQQQSLSRVICSLWLVPIHYIIRPSIDKLKQGRPELVHRPLIKSLISVIYAATSADKSGSRVGWPINAGVRSRPAGSRLSLCPTLNCLAPKVVARTRR